MLNGLALARRRSLGDGAGGEEDELLGRVPLEEPKVADVGGVGHHHRIRLRRIRALQDEDRRDLHRIEKSTDQIKSRGERSKPQRDQLNK